MSAFAGWSALSGAAEPDPRIESIFEQALDTSDIGPARKWRGACIVLVHRQHVTAPEDIGDRQPRQGDRSPLTIVFDGYLINRQDVIAALNLPAEAGGWPDSALVLAALEQWGPAAPERLLGDFALACWNALDRTLLLARDGIGQRPLYYHHGRDFFAFATTPRSLLALPDVPTTLDEARFARFMVDLPGSPEATFFSSIKRLPPGCTAILSAGQLRQHRYWQPDFGRRIRLKRDTDYVEAARELLDRAVNACLRIQGPPVAAITGGLDSSGVAATALRWLPGQKLASVTAVHTAPTRQTAGSYDDERPFVEAIARMHPGLDPAFLSGSDLHAWDARWPEMFLLTGMPWRNVMNIAWLGPSRDHARQSGARVMLSGLFGNMTLSWSGAEALPSAFLRGDWRFVAREVAGLAAAAGEPRARPFWQHVVRPILSSRLKPNDGAAVARRLRFSALDPEVVHGFGLDQEIVAHHRAANGNAEALRRLHFASLQSAGDVVGAGRALHGLEMRSPLADRRLLEFCIAIPDAQYLRGGVPRALARRVLADRLPTEVINNLQRGDQGADYFHRMTLQRERLVAGVGELERSALAGRFLDVPRMRALAQAWPSSPADAGMEYMAVLHRGLHSGQFLRWIEGGNG